MLNVHIITHFNAWIPRKKTNYSTIENLKRFKIAFIDSELNSGNTKPRHKERNEFFAATFNTFSILAASHFTKKKNTSTVPFMLVILNRKYLKNSTTYFQSNLLF